MGVRFEAHDGNSIKFWEDWWVGRGPLREKYPRLFNICANPAISLGEAYNGHAWGLELRRNLDPHDAIDLTNLTREVESIRRDHHQDVVKWALEASGSFSTNSLYLKLCSGNSLLHFRDVWKTKIPNKIKIFLW